MKTVLVHERPTSGAKQSRPAERRPNLAARVGRWSAAHWKTATFGWLALVLLAFAVGSQVGTKQADPTKAGPGESGRMDRILDAGFKVPASESVLIQSSSARAGTPAFDAAVEGRRRATREGGAVQNVRRRSIRPTPARSQGRARRARRVRDPRRQHQSDGQARPGPRERRRLPNARIPRCSSASSAARVRQRPSTPPSRTTSRARACSPIPLTLIILVVAFGALVAAGIPLLLALTAVFATFGLAALPSHLIPLAPEAFAVVLLVGLAVGVDYSMFYLRREREERAAGRSERAALEAAAATSGRSVLISGLTVMVAMAGLFLTGDATFASFGYATMIVVAVRDARLADRAPGAAFEARRRRRPAAGPARRQAAQRQGRGPDLGSDRRPRPPPASALRGDRRRTPARARRSCTPAADGDTRSGHLPQVARRGEDLQPHAARVPGHGAARLRRRQGRRTSMRRQPARRSGG